MAAKQRIDVIGRNQSSAPVVQATRRTYRGDILRLYYARAPELEPWLDLVTVRGEAAVTFGPG
jgi:hypothetical protein